MTSSMSTGDRRWASSTRRSGMTVLGKVAVPKPINLPSQKLENHGLDPNVEIVPKGTIGWGGKSYSQTNAWGSSSVSPSMDGGTGSPSHLSDRPSSCGSITQPSTAESDRPHEPDVSKWGPNSRPSSASGALSSNQSSLSTLRPHSAETRPGSSPLSRFAEPLSENPVARGETTTKVISSSKNDGFSLTSGDFPSLGSEKEIPGKNAGTQGDAHVTASSDNGATNTWRRDEQFGEDDMRQEDVHSYPNASMPPHRYEMWHGPPVNNPSGGVWYRGHPYGAPLPPGSFPMEPFPYYHPHFSANALANPQPVPPRGVGPRGHQPMNGDMYRPLMPDPYIRPGLPIRPGFCPGPVPYESYYSPPMGYCNPSKQDMPFMGLPRRPVYGEYPSQNASDPAKFHASSGGHTGKAPGTQQVESDHFHDSRGPYKLLMKQHNGSDRQTLEDTVAMSIEKGDQDRNSRHTEWEVENKKDELIATQRAAQSETNAQVSDRHTGSNSVNMHSSEKVSNKKLPEIKSTKKMEISASSLGVSQSTAAAHKDSSLIQKIDDLNEKTRVSDAQPRVISDCSREEQNTKSQLYHKAPIPGNSSGTGSLPSEGFQSFEARKPITRRSDFSSRRYTGKQNRIDTTPAADSLCKESGVHLWTDANEYSQEHHAAAKGRERPATYSQKKHWGGPAQQMLHANDIRGQERAKIRESPEQHSTQLQRSKASEKLKESYMHTYEVQDSNQNLENVAEGSIMNKQEECCTVTEAKLIVGTSVGPNKCSISAPKPNLVVPVTVNDANRNERPTSSVNVQDRRPKRPQKVQNQPLSFQMEVNNLDSGGYSNASQNHENIASKIKPSGYKQKHKVPSESYLADSSHSSGNIIAPKCHADEADNVTGSVEVTCDIVPSSGSSVPAGQTPISESLVHQKRRSNWTGKGKAPTSASLPSRKAEIRNTSVESGNLEPVESELVLSSVQSGIVSKDANPSSGQLFHVRTEENPDGINSQWKSQHSGQMPRNPPSTRSSGKLNAPDADAVMWAPVRSQNRIEVTDGDGSQKRIEVTDDDSYQNRSEVTYDDTSRKTVLEAAVSSQRVDHYVRTNPKSKRAEIERYVPKPVAKEMAQQASIQQPPSPAHVQSPASETVEGVDSDLKSVGSPQLVGTILKGGPSTETGNGSGRHINQGKAHGSWRPRSSESAQGLHDGSSYSLKTGKYNSMNAKPDGAPGKEQLQHFSDHTASDSWNIQDRSDAVAHANLTKDQGAIARGKRPFYKGHKGMVNSHDQEKNASNQIGDNTEAHSSAPDMIRTDFTSAKENYNVAERPTSHWQPKPQGASNRRGGRSSGRDDVRTNKREYLPHSGVRPQQHKETRQAVEPHTGHSVSEKSNEAPDQNKREIKSLSSGERPRTPNQASADLIECISPPTTDTRHEQITSSCRNVRSNRFSRGHDSSTEWSLRGQDYRKHNPSGNWERPRNNTNCQYKAVEPYNNRSNDNEGLNDGSQGTGSNYVEKGQSRSRRGRGYGRQRGHVRVNGGFD